MFNSFDKTNEFFSKMREIEEQIKILEERILRVEENKKETVKKWQARQCYVLIASFLKNKWKYIRFCLLFLLFFLILIFFTPKLANFFISALFNINSFNLLYYLIFYTFFIIEIYLFLIIFGKGVWLEKNQGFVIVLGIIIPIILVFWQQSLENVKYVSLINEDNERNNRHIDSIIHDISEDPYVIFWRNFYTENYKKYWDYISLNYSQDCKNLYAELTLSMDGLNNMIRTRNDLLIKPDFIQMSIEKLNRDTVVGASVAKTTLNKIIGKCQK